MRNKGLSLSAAQASGIALPALHSLSDSLVLMSTSVYCLGLTHWSCHPLAHYSFCILAQREENTAKHPRSHPMPGEGARTALTQHSTAGSAAAATTPDKTWHMNVRPGSKILKSSEKEGWSFLAAMALLQRGLLHR